MRDGLRVRAAENGRSMEEEARLILAGALDTENGSHETNSGAALFSRLHDVFADIGGVDLPLFPDAPYEPPPLEDEQ